MHIYIYIIHTVVYVRFLQTLVFISVMVMTPVTLLRAPYVCMYVYNHD